MNKDAAMVTEMHLMEVIHVELPDKRRETVVPEIFGKDDFLQLFLVEDPNPFAFGIPIDDLGIFLRLN